MAIHNDVIDADFWADWERLAARQIEANGYELSTLHNDQGETRSLQFFALNHRLVEARPRQVHSHWAFVCPSEHEAGYRMLIKEVMAGHQLAPRMSRKAHRLGFHDAMFNEWGIHHFHLGTTRDHRGLWTGARDVVFAIVRPDDFYVISIQSHRALDFVDVDLLQKVRDEWPDLVAPFILSAEGVSQSPPPAERVLLRRAGINVITQLGTGEVVLGPGGGLTMAGGPIVAKRLEIEFRRWLRDAEEWLKDVGLDMEREIHSHCPDATRPYRFVLELDGDSFFATLVGTRVGVKLGSPT